MTYKKGSREMKRLTCEVCGGTNIIKKDGVFECQDCGTKYTLEDAKKLLIEGKVDVSGSTVKIDNTNLIANYQEIADNAYKAGNLKEAENYCNKILEIDPSNSNTWILKGKVAGWQSNLQNGRIKEALDYFQMAIKNCDEVNKNSAIQQITHEIKDIINATVQTSENFLLEHSNKIATKTFDDVVNAIFNVKETCCYIEKDDFIDYYSQIGSFLAGFIVNYINRISGKFQGMTNNEFEQRDALESAEILIGTRNTAKKMIESPEVRLSLINTNLQILPVIILNTLQFTPKYISDFNGRIMYARLKEEERKEKIERLLEIKKIRKYKPNYPLNLEKLDDVDTVSFIKQLFPKEYEAYINKVRQKEKEEQLKAQQRRAILEKEAEEKRMMTGNRVIVFMVLATAIFLFVLLNDIK